MLKLKDLVYPLFVKKGNDLREEVASMPGIYRFSSDTLAGEAGELLKLGIEKVLLFGVSDEKDTGGKAAYEEGNAVSQAVKRLKKNFPDLIVMTDVCLCAYTSHGHCGVIKSGETKIAHRETLDALGLMALSHTEAGADYVAPSAMVKEQVLAIRRALDENRFKRTGIMAYSAKFASNFYGPFRDIARSAPIFGDRSAYQLNFSNNSRTAMKELEEDIREGADIVMVKPALAYLDIIKEASLKFNRPLAAYNVSGEYAMVKEGARSGAWDEKKMVFEIMAGIKRAGADIIITYHAKEIAKWTRGE